MITNYICHGPLNDADSSTYIFATQIQPTKLCSSYQRQAIRLGSKLLRECWVVCDYYSLISKEVERFWNRRLPTNSSRGSRIRTLLKLFEQSASIRFLAWNSKNFEWPVSPLYRGGLIRYVALFRIVDSDLGVLHNNCYFHRTFYRSISRHSERA